MREPVQVRSRMRQAGRIVVVLLVAALGAAPLLGDGALIVRVVAGTPLVVFAVEAGVERAFRGGVTWATRLEAAEGRLRVDGRDLDAAAVRRVLLRAAEQHDTEYDRTTVVYQAVIVLEDEAIVARTGWHREEIEALAQALLVALGRRGSPEHARGPRVPRDVWAIAVLLGMLGVLAAIGGVALLGPRLAPAAALVCCAGIWLGIGHALGARARRFARGAYRLAAG